MVNCSDCKNWDGCIIEASFARFTELIEVRDKINVGALEHCLAGNCYKFERER